MIEEKTAGSEKMAAAREAQAESKNDTNIIHVKVYSPFKIYYDEASYSISGVNRTGPFDILARHHNFMTLLDACELSIRPLTGKNIQKIRISGGLMHVKADRVTVFLDI